MMQQPPRYTFKSHDTLNREKFAQFLFHLIEHRDEYRREPDNTDAYYIAIDGSYGSGKTRFLQMFQSYIEDKKNEYSILYYNAWEHDIFNDALSSFVYQISNSDLFTDTQEQLDSVKRKKSIQDIAKVALTAIVAVGTQKIFGGDGVDVIKSIQEHVEDKVTENDLPNPYELRRQSMGLLTDALSHYTKEHPLIVIIDELDRCTPTFAIQTFEVVKHLLNVPDTIFLFAVDMKQMRATVQKVYGAHIDADGYICKIFDYISVFPRLDMTEYVHGLLVSWKDPELLQNLELVAHIELLFNRSTCSLRDINAILQSYRIMWNTFLKDYRNTQAYCLYFDCLFLKHQNLNLYNRLSSPSGLSEKEVSDIKSTIVPAETINLFLQKHNTPIWSDSKYLFSGDDVCKSHFVHISFAEHGRVADIQEGMQHTYFDLSYESSLNHLLFFPDFLQYSEYSLLTYGQYIHHQLEMFNFSQPKT